MIPCASIDVGSTAFTVPEDAELLSGLDHQVATGETIGQEFQHAGRRIEWKRCSSRSVTPGS